MFSVCWTSNFAEMLLLKQASFLAGYIRLPMLKPYKLFCRATLRKVLTRKLASVFVRGGGGIYRIDQRENFQLATSR